VVDDERDADSSEPTERWEQVPAGFLDGSPPVFGPRPTRRRGVVAGWSAAAVALVALVAMAAFVHVSANRSFDVATAALQSAVSDVGDVAGALVLDADDAARVVAASEAITAAAADDLVDAAARADFAHAASVLQAAVEAAERPLDAVVPAGPPMKPLWTWELTAKTSRLETTTADLTQLAAELESAGVTIDRAAAALIDASHALYASVAPAAAAIEAANVSAQHVAVLDFRDAGAAAAQQTKVGSPAADAFATYAEKAAAIKASAQAELAEKAGPLLATRLEIEAFARSIAGGVVLDFDWAPFVNGIGGAYGMSGTAWWDHLRGGYSTITLSDSVAENWPSADAQALVVHEVGHAITAKCGDMFDSSNRTSNEQWATAWAISMGHTAVGNGVQAYGYPPADLIETAAGCR